MVDVDWYVEDDQPKYRLLVDQEKAALNGISEDEIARTMRIGVGGISGRTAARRFRRRKTCRSCCGWTAPSRSDLERIQDLEGRGPHGQPGGAQRAGARHGRLIEDKSIYHKNLMPVTYVTGDVAGAMESPVYAILKLGPEMDKFKRPKATPSSSTWRRCPPDSDRYAMKWDGEWHITYEVFRDLGIAFAAVLILIYVLVVGWFQSFMTPLVIMAAIPFSLVGILPAHGLMGAFFTATSMIGFIAGAGIVVRNSIILVDFVELRLQRGHAAGRGRDRRRRGALPPDDADRRGGRGGRGDHPLRPDLPGTGHRADGRRSGLAGALAHDRPDRLLRRESKEESCMTIERYLRLIAGFFVMVSVALGYWVNPNWFLFTAFVGLNLFQSAFTNWCPMITFLREVRGAVFRGR